MIHQYKLMGRNIVIDAGGGCIHDVDDVAYDAIAALSAAYDAAEPRAVDDAEEAALAALLEKYSEDESITRAELTELFEDIAALRAEGRLFAEDVSELAGTADAADGGAREIKALCLHVAHACNLICDYCFAGQGTYYGASALMSFETARRAVDFLIEASGKKRNLEVDFFGGEPLLNWDVVKKTIMYAREIEGARGKNFRFTLTTNGVLLDDEVTDFCNREISNVVLSLDG
ncbi:MAG: radical SAM protein, partial [Oscillospiraceae bacterium]|nr:radical SAM protein [Oscillospiraceae bacterium]